MLVQKDQRIVKKIASEGTVFEYNISSRKLGLAVSELHGRVPDNGVMVNNECDEAYYVISGNATVFFNDQEFFIKEDDCLFIEPGKQFYVNANHLRIVIPTSPPWSSNQWQNVI